MGDVANKKLSLQYTQSKIQGIFSSSISGMNLTIRGISTSTTPIRINNVPKTVNSLSHLIIFSPFHLIHHVTTLVQDFFTKFFFLEINNQNFILIFIGSVLVLKQETSNSDLNSLFQLALESFLILTSSHIGYILQTTCPFRFFDITYSFHSIVNK